jgi:hypothetical protein
MAKKYTFNISYLVAYTNNEEVSVDDFGFENQLFTIEAMSYEAARVSAIMHAHETIKHFYEPLGVVAYMRVEKMEG